MDANRVIIGAPEQLTTGAGLVAPVGTALPKLADLTRSGLELDEAFKPYGYVTEDGITLSFGMSTGTIKDWGLNSVKRYLEEFDGKLSFSFMETSSAVLGLLVGEDNVEAVAATEQDGAKAMAKFGPWMAPAKSWVFKVKDGDARIVIVVPNGQVTSISDVTVNATSAVTWGVDLSCNVGPDGASIIVMTDDGLVSA